VFYSFGTCCRVLFHLVMVNSNVFNNYRRLCRQCAVTYVLTIAAFASEGGKSLSAQVFARKIVEGDADGFMAGLVSDLATGWPHWG